MMKTLNFLILAVFFLVKCNSNIDNENCVWTYRCCEFKEINNVTKCLKMCEPLINCNQTSTTLNSNEIENFNTTSPSDEQPQPFFFRRRTCRKGFKYVNGQCRKLL